MRAITTTYVIKNGTTFREIKIVKIVGLKMRQPVRIKRP